MSDKRPPFVPSGTPSGNHPAVDAFRKKADSIVEITIPQLDALNESLAQANSSPPTPTTPAPLSPVALSAKSDSVAWQITIQGVDVLRDRPAVLDAARLVSDLMSALRSRGHAITYASFMHGGEEVLTSAPAPLPPKEIK